MTPVSIEEIASAAEVSKPVVYEHFGGKEGLYQVIVDREVTQLSEMLSQPDAPGPTPAGHVGAHRPVPPRLHRIQRGRIPPTFHQSPTAVSGGRSSRVIADVAEQVTDLWHPSWKNRASIPRPRRSMASSLAGAIGRIGQWWVDVREPSKEETAAHVVNLLLVGPSFDGERPEADGTAVVVIKIPFW